jgi:hypothetical protein
MQNIRDNTDVCQYDNLKLEMKGLNDNLGIYAEFKDMAFKGYIDAKGKQHDFENWENDLRIWLEHIKTLRAEIEEMKFKLLCFKGDYNYQIIYNYDRYILNMKSNKNYFDREIKRLKDYLYRLTPQPQPQPQKQPFSYSRFFKDNHTIQQ